MVACRENPSHMQSLRRASWDGVWLAAEKVKSMIDSLDKQMKQRDEDSKKEKEEGEKQVHSPAALTQI